MIPLAGFAIVLLIVGILTADEFTAIGWGFVGAAIVRIVDIGQERSRVRAKEMEDRRRGLDETRRLLYTALVSKPGTTAELDGTLINALAHHGLAVPFDESQKYLSRWVYSGPGLERAEWIKIQIEIITEALDRPFGRR